MKNNSLPKTYNGIVEQLIRPTGLLDPEIEVRPSEKNKKDELLKSLKSNKLINQYNKLMSYECANQIDDLIAEIKKTVDKKQRVLTTTLTKRMAEDLAAYLADIGIKGQYLHSEIDTVERVEILRDLRLGKYDVVVGINLLREGLDLPEVSLVTILDADKEGFLRSEVSLVQTIGRAARHEEGRVIMYADSVTGSMNRAIQETERRRKIQEKFNKKHNIKPKSIKKEIKDQLQKIKERDSHVSVEQKNLNQRIGSYPAMNPKEKKRLLNDLEAQMLLFADQMKFEKAAKLRDAINDLKG